MSKENLNSLARAWNEEQDQLICPWDDHKSHHVVSDEPLAILRLALDQRLLSGRSPEAHLYATDEMIGRAQSYTAALIEAGVGTVHTHAIGSWLTDSEGTIQRAFTIGREYIDTDSMLNATSGAAPLRMMLKDAALDNGASIASISAFTNGDIVRHDHGSAGVSKLESLQTKWDLLGVQGLIQAFGRHIALKDSGSIRNGSDVTEGRIGYSKEEEGVMLEIQQVLMTSEAVALAGMSITLSNRKEIDAIAIANGKLYHIEAKGCQPHNVASNIYNANRQFNDPNGIISAHKKRVLVLPSAPEEMISEIKNNDKAQAAQAALDLAALSGVTVVGAKDFANILS